MMIAIVDISGKGVSAALIMSLTLLIAQVQQFMGTAKQHDDMTIVVLQPALTHV